MTDWMHMGKVKTRIVIEQYEEGGQLHLFIDVTGEECRMDQVVGIFEIAKVQYINGKKEH